MNRILLILLVSLISLSPVLGEVIIGQSNSNRVTVTTLTIFNATIACPNGYALQNYTTGSTQCIYVNNTGSSSGKFINTSTGFGGDVSGTYSAIVVKNKLNTSTSFSGDVSGTYSSFVVKDNSHKLSIVNITGLDKNICSGTDKVSNVTFNNGNLEVVCTADVSSSSNTVNTTTQFSGDVSGTYNSIVVKNKLNTTTNFAGTYISGVYNALVFDWNRFLTSNTTLTNSKLNKTDQRYNESGKINALNNSKANAGNCAIGTVVQNATSTGVQCITDKTGTSGAFLNTSTGFGGDVTGTYSAILIKNKLNTTTQFGRDLVGTYGAISVKNNSHTLSIINITGLDKNICSGQFVTNVTFNNGNLEITCASASASGTFLNTSTVFDGDVTGTYLATIVKNKLNTTTNFAGDVSGVYNAIVVGFKNAFLTSNTTLTNNKLNKTDQRYNDTGVIYWKRQAGTLLPKTSTDNINITGTGNSTFFDDVTIVGKLYGSGANPVIFESGLDVLPLSNCDTIDTDLTGNFACGTDAGKFSVNTTTNFGGDVSGVYSAIVVKNKLNTTTNFGGDVSGTYGAIAVKDNSTRISLANITTTSTATCSAGTVAQNVTIGSVVTTQCVTPTLSDTDTLNTVVGRGNFSNSDIVINKSDFLFYDYASAGGARRTIRFNMYCASGLCGNPVFNIENPNGLKVNWTVTSFRIGLVGTKVRELLQIDSGGGGTTSISANGSDTIRFDNNVGFSTGSLFDVINNKLGINTTSPSHQLTVVGHTNITGDTYIGPKNCIALNTTKNGKVQCRDLPASSSGSPVNTSTSFGGDVSGVYSAIVVKNKLNTTTAFGGDVSGAYGAIVVKNKLNTTTVFSGSVTANSKYNTFRLKNNSLTLDWNNVTNKVLPFINTTTVFIGSVTANAKWFNFRLKNNSLVIAGENVTTGTIADIRLSPKVALLNRTGQIFTNQMNLFKNLNLTGIGNITNIAQIAFKGNLSTHRILDNRTCITIQGSTTKMIIC